MQGHGGCYIKESPFLDWKDCPFAKLISLPWIGGPAPAVNVQYKAISLTYASLEKYARVEVGHVRRLHYNVPRGFVDTFLARCTSNLSPAQGEGKFKIVQIRLRSLLSLLVNFF